jgi:homospermidine synthase
LEAGNWLVHAAITGPVVMIGFGSIGRGTLPLLERHFTFDKSRMTVIDPVGENRAILEERGVSFLKKAITAKNYRKTLQPLLTNGDGQGVCINLSVDTSSLDIMRLCRELGVLYVDTVIEPWKGFYYDDKVSNAARTNYALRETLLAEKRRSPGGPTAVACCGANPGMVSWFVKQAVLDIAHETDENFVEPKYNDREGWAKLMRKLGVKGIHIAERDTQRAKLPKPLKTFWNTWSVEGLLSESLQPAELGWGTHEKWMPKNAKQHKKGSGASIYLNQPGGNTRVRTWCPTPGPQYGLLVTHNEAISISDYYTVRNGGGEAVYRPTCHYAYHPCNVAVLSMDELFGAGGKIPKRLHVLNEDEILDGADELGVLLYGHKKNAYWYGSHLTIDDARRLAPYQNATGLQVTSAVIAGLVWALENPNAGIVETDEIDFRRCLQIQRPYLGNVRGKYTNWNPLKDKLSMFPRDIDLKDPWQFRNILVH